MIVLSTTRINRVSNIAKHAFDGRFSDNGYSRNVAKHNYSFITVAIEQGTGITDDDGNIIYDDDGNVVHDDDGN